MENNNIEEAVKELKLFMEDHLGRILEGSIKRYLNEVLDEREGKKSPELSSDNGEIERISEEYKEYLMLRLKVMVLNDLNNIRGGERNANFAALYEYVHCDDEAMRRRYKEVFRTADPIYGMFVAIDESRPRVEKILHEYSDADSEGRERIRESVKNCDFAAFSDDIFDMIDDDPKDWHSWVPSPIWDFVKTRIDDILDKSATIDDVKDEIKFTLNELIRVREDGLDKQVK